MLGDRPAIHAARSNLSIDQNDAIIDNDDLIAYVYDDPMICRDDHRYRWSFESPVYVCIRGIYAAVYSRGSVIAPVHRAAQVRPACRITCRYRENADALVEAVGEPLGGGYF